MGESLKGKVAVISGVGSGFAKATAELFAKHDQVSLVMFDIDETGLKATAAACESPGSKVVAFTGDATKPETFARALKECVDHFGKIDFLINYAGGALKVAPIEEMDDAINRTDHRPEPHQHHHELPHLHAPVQEAGLRKDHQRVQRLRPPLLAGVGRVLGCEGGRQRVHEVPVHRASAPRNRRDAPGSGRLEHGFPEGGAGSCQVRVGREPSRCVPSTSPTWSTRPARSPGAAACQRCSSTAWRRT